jgi:dihydrofolate reductase
MRRIIGGVFLSLDGVMQAPGHAREDEEDGFALGGWSAPFMGEHRRLMTEAFATAGAVLLGRRTYEIFAAYWPTVTDPGDDIARVLNGVPKYVVSTTLREPAWQPAVIIDGDVAGRVAELRQQPGKDVLVVGSSRVAQSLLEHRLVDEYRLILHPVVLGGGKRLFGEGGPPVRLALRESRATAGGLVTLSYVPEA